MNRALRQGKTADIAENYRPIFKLFLTVFDLRREHAKSLSLEVSCTLSLFKRAELTLMTRRTSERSRRTVSARSFSSSSN